MKEEGSSRFYTWFYSVIATLDAERQRLAAWRGPPLARLEVPVVIIGLVSAHQVFYSVALPVQPWSSPLPPTTTVKKPFWQRKTLEQLSKREWESLCDGCGRCCLNKYEEDSGEILYTDVACKLLDTQSCRCSNYRQRQKLVPDCISLTPQTMRDMSCLPPTCGYRLVQEGKNLYWWHPLVSGRAETVHEAKISVRGRVVSELGLSEAEIEVRLVRWPQTKTAVKRPKAAGKG